MDKPPKVTLETIDGDISTLSQELEALGMEYIEAESAQDATWQQEIENDIAIQSQELERLRQQRAPLLTKQRFKREDARKALASGEHRVFSKSMSADSYAPTYGTPRTFLDRESTEQNLRQLVPQALGVEPSAIDFETSLPASELTALTALPTMQDKLEYMSLPEKYGKGNVFPLNINGSDEVAVRLPSGSIVTSATGKNMMQQAAGAVGPTAREVPSMAAGVLSGAGTLAVTRSPALAVGAAASTETTVGTVQDILFRKLLGIETKKSEALMRRGQGAVIGAGIEGAGGMVASKFARKLGGKAVPNAFQSEGQAAAQRLSKRYAKDFRASPAEAFGPRATKEAAMLAGSRRGKNVARRFEVQQQRLMELYQKWIGDAAPNEQRYIASARRLMDSQENLVKKIAGNDAAMEGAMLKNLQRQRDALARRTENKESLGNFIYDEVTKFEEAAVLAKDKAYVGAHKIANDNGFSVTPEEMLRQLRKAQRENEITTSAAVDKQIARMKQRIANGERLRELKKEAGRTGSTWTPEELQQEIMDLEKWSGPLSSGEFAEVLRGVKGDIPQGGLTAAPNEKIATGKAMGPLEQLRYRKYKLAGAWDAFQEADQVYHQRMGFTRGNIGSILKNDFGEMAKEPQQVIDTVLRYPTTAKRILRMADEADPAQAAAMRERLQNMYMEQIGAKQWTDVGRRPTGLAYDEEMVDALWGATAGGQQKLSASMMKVALKEYDEALRKYGLPSTMDVDDIRKMAGTLQKGERRQILRELVDKSSNQRALERAQNNAVAQLVKKGEYNDHIPSDALYRAFMSADDQTARAMKLALRDDAEGFKGDIVNHLLRQFSGSPNRTTSAPFDQFFDSESFLKKVAPDPKKASPFRKKLDIALGPEKTQDLIDFARLMESNKVLPVKEGEQVRSVIGPGGFSFYLAQGLTAPLRDRMVAAALSSDLLQRAGLLKLAARKVSDEQKEKVLQKAMVGLFTTNRGARALANITKDDPEMSAELDQLIDDFRQNQQRVMQGDFGQ